MQDPRLTRPEPDTTELDELNQSLSLVSEDAEAADRLLRSDIVKNLFEKTALESYSEFLELPTHATLEQYRKVHFKAIAMIGLREHLRNKVESRSKILKHIRHLTDHQGEE